ncbi:MAG: ParA family protein [Planctomycetes bacterium]|nr:ParA family protein [Planctomycetota bacterium]
MHILALANQKGGCGKTTAAINLAAALAAHGERVLLVDLDPQGHATLGLGHDPAATSARLDTVLLGHEPAAALLLEAPGSFTLLAGGPCLAEFEARAEQGIDASAALARALAPLAERYDWCVLDCPPRADGVLTLNALRACDTVLLVVETGAFALQGALRAREIFRAALESLGRSAANAPRLRVLATLFDRRTRFAREVLVAMHARFGADLFDTAIRSHVRLREAAAWGLPVRELDASCPAAEDFDHLAAELLERAPGAARAVLTPRRRRRRGAVVPRVDKP